MQTKFLEIRDSATFIPALAIKLTADDEFGHYLLRRAGFGPNQNYIILHHLESSEFQYYPFSWPNRTMHQAHLYIQDHFDELQSGDVIDVEFILGETMTKKLSERITNYQTDHIYLKNTEI